MYIFIFQKYEELVGWGKKYDDLQRKNVNIGGRGEKRGKRGNLHCTLGKKYHY